MNRITTYAALSQVTSADLNELQDRIAGMRPGDAATNDFDAASDGCNGVFWQAPDTTGIPNDNYVAVDASIDWRDYWVWGWFYPNGASVGSDLTRMGQENDYELNDHTSTGPYQFCGYLGTGGLSSLITGNGVSGADPPVNGYTSPYRSHYVQLGDSTNDLRLFCDPTDGELFIYNDTASDYFSSLMLFGVKVGKR